MSAQTYKITFDVENASEVGRLVSQLRDRIADSGEGVEVAAGKADTETQSFVDHLMATVLVHTGYEVLKHSVWWVVERYGRSVRVEHEGKTVVVSKSDPDSVDQIGKG